MPNAFALRRLLAALPALLIASSAWAGPPSDTLVPNSTKGYLSVANPKQFDERWDKTQLGQMFNDEVMKQFVDDFHNQIKDDFGTIERKLGLTWDDLRDVPSGEASVSVIERKNRDAALAITMDVTGHKKQADAMLAAVEKRLTGRGGRKSTATVTGATLTVYDFPAAAGAKAQQTVYFVKDDVLVGVDDRAEAEAMLKRFAGDSKDNLKSVAAYTITMERCKKEAGNLEPEARWFVEPFGFIFAVRTLREQPRKIDQDIARILFQQGFEAIQGAGGYVNQLVDGGVELLARTSVYAPAAAGKENDPLRWQLSMRMLQLPNTPAFEPQSWAPRMSASYTTLNLNLADAFENIGPVFDAVQEHEDAWKNTLEGWRDDPYGQQVDVRKEFIGNMGNRLTVLTNNLTPVTEDCEKSVFAIEAKNEAALAKTLEKWMKNERDVVRREVNGFVIYERTRANNAVEDVEVEVPGFETIGAGGKAAGGQKKDRERVLPNSAVTVALGHLMMASDITYLTELLEGYAQRERLASAADYQQVLAALDKLAPGERSGWAFGRSDEEFRPTFELIRDGKMPQSKSMLGKLLNNILTTEEERHDGVPRKQKIDGTHLPEFESVRRYFGPHGRVIRSEKDGWFVTGALLNKEAP